MDHLTEQDAGLLEQAASMLEGLANDERNRGNCSSSEGAACSAHAIRRLAPAMLRAGRGCLAQIEEPAGAAPAAVAPQGDKDDSLLLCASDLQHSAIYDSHSEMQDCARSVADRIKALAAPALEAPAAPPVPVDEFRGDTPSLVRNIVALLELDADGALVPHGVGGHARGLLSAAAARLAAAPQAPAPAPGMAVTALAGEIIAALEADEKDGGYDLTSGLFGPKFSELVRRWAASEWASVTAPQTPAAPVGTITDAMVDAYLTAQRRTVEKADRFGRPVALHTNTVREACRQGLLAAIGAAPAAPSDAQLLLEWDRVSGITEATKRRLACMRAVLQRWGSAAPAAPAVDESFEDLISDWAHGDALDAEYYRTLSQAARDVLAERRRQVCAEGYEPEADAMYESGELARAAATYALLATGDDSWRVEDNWPWGMSTLKRADPRRMLEKAGALILADMERIDRAAQAKEGGEPA